MFACRPLAMVLVSLTTLVGASACHAASGRFPHAVITPQPGGVVAAEALKQASGKPFRIADYRGRWLWLYFGYANCPDVCPAALDAMSVEFKQLVRPEAVQGVFVSVDPARDTPAKLAEFVRYYNPHFVGVTGDRPALDALAKAVGAGYVIDPPAKPGDGYNVSHTNMLFVIDPAGHYVATYVPGAAKGDLASDFNGLTAKP